MESSTLKKASLWFGRIVIIGILLISIINCFVRIENLNYVLTIISGVIINVGTIFQIIFILVNSKVIFTDYPIYLFVGMSVLEVCQVYSYAIEGQAIVSVIVGNTISVVVNILFNIVLFFKNRSANDI